MDTWQSLWPQKVTGSLEVTVTYCMTSKISMTICCRIDLVYDLKGHRAVRGSRDLPYDPKRSQSLKVAVTYFMTPKVTVTFAVGLT